MSPSAVSRAAQATLHNRRRSLTPFLAWLAARGRAWQATTLEDVTAYLASRPQWSRATIACHVQSLRAPFRHGATRGWCRGGLAETIDAPRPNHVDVIANSMAGALFSPPRPNHEGVAGSHVGDVIRPHCEVLRPRRNTEGLREYAVRVYHTDVHLRVVGAAAGRVR
jgi:hypothetical protein